ncbi:MAG: hypothetical protein R3286_02185, partial [Gammaproteobacteria bacterium]|nr:hypothetical protein [Gammaproteobacteria bacterium]
PGTPADSLTPTISQRKITSTVAVQSGQTVVLGGLIREQKSLSRSGVPGLYNLPILGPLFGSTSDDQNRTELVVLITPRAVRNSGDAQRVTEEFRNKMESLRPLDKPKLGPDGRPEPEPTERSWPRVGPDEPKEVSRAAPGEPPLKSRAEIPIQTRDPPAAS